jgi:geranylgeranyl pyrophosphate synthase
MQLRQRAGERPAALFLSEAAAICEQALQQTLPAEDIAPSRLHRAMRYAVFAGGKRLRPALVLAACRTLGGADANCRAAMTAVELLHTYTLVHDDLPAMDDDDLRRGRPTCHRAFDEATAILAGDALQTLAFAEVAKIGSDAVICLAEAAGSIGVVGGQQDDLDAEGGAATDAAPVLLERIHRRKTAELIRASCELGAIAAHATTAQRHALGEYGRAVGLAFQIADDVLDATANAETLGKTPGKDLAQGKLTYVSVYGLDQARREAQRWHSEALTTLAALGRDVTLLTDLADFIVHRDR